MRGRIAAGIAFVFILLVAVFLYRGCRSGDGLPDEQDTQHRRPGAPALEQVAFGNAPSGNALAGEASVAALPLRRARPLLAREDRPPLLLAEQAAGRTRGFAKARGFQKEKSTLKENLAPR